MSIAQNPFFGAMRKSMANFTTTTYKGLNIVRSKAFMKKDPKTELQLKQRLRMTLIAMEYRVFGNIVKLSFVEKNSGNAPYNMFVAANFKSAFDDTGEQPVISYPLLLVSKGSLPAMKVIESVVGDKEITVRYDTNLSLPKVFATDEIVALVKTNEREVVVGRCLRGSEDEGTVVIPVARIDVNNIVCCYIFARSADGKKTSNSVFIETPNP